MRPLYVSGFAAVSSAGMRAGALAERVGADSGAGGPVDGLYPEPLPTPAGHAFVEFNATEVLGRKGTSFYDRATALAVVACGAALRDAGVELDEQRRERTGVALGTTVGSFKSTSDYTRETLVQPKPYLVNPVLFPNTVMNCAAGQAAIRYGLRGVNATIAGGTVAFLEAVRYAARVLHRGYADTMLIGAVEEFTPHRSWIAALTGDTPAGEAAAVFTTTASPRPAHAEILAVANAFGPGSGAAAALAGCVRRCLRDAAVDAAKISLIATCEPAPADAAESGPATEVLGRTPEVLRVAELFGSCGAATGALALATITELHRARARRDGELAVLTARTAEGAVAAAIVRGRGHAGTDRG